MEPLKNPVILPPPSSRAGSSSILTFYQCTLCKVLFEKREQCLAHRDNKHPSGPLVLPPPTLSATDQDDTLDLEQTTADVVKLDGLKRSSTLKQIRCHFCNKELIHLYSESILLVMLEDNELNPRHCCKNCFNGKISEMQ